ncbi:MAG: PKD domain-containing protein, partial [Verrucomicrobia bacterium]|nr:PKD domain-containing protein [Verrucomicrobiota bacterium]
AATVPGALVLVSNGVYQTGGRVVYGSMTNRIAVTKPLVVRSVNGPGVTLIKGYQVPGTINGNGAVRCVYLANGATLTGFTLTNGATRTSGDYDQDRNGGGIWCVSTLAAVSNCVLAGNSAYYYGGGVYSGTLNNCTLSGNSADYGGGVCYGTLNNCTLTGNLAAGTHAYGGGAYFGMLNNCTLSGNSASYGGGAYSGTLNKCTLSGNSASYGGGADGGTLNNCTLSGNSAAAGGGAYYGTLNNCTISGNSASSDGGGACGDSFSIITLNNCTLTGNYAAVSGGGACWADLNNCIVYYNTGADGNYDSFSTLNYCCTPLPANGINNLTVEPQLASASHLSANSPCRAAGSAAYVSGVDIDGEPWAHPPAIGCDEYWSGSVTGMLSAAIVASYTNVAVGFGVDFQAMIGGRVSASSWDFGDGVVVSNRPYASHAWAGSGDYVVVLRAYNEDCGGHCCGPCGSPAGALRRLGQQVAGFAV